MRSPQRSARNGGRSPRPTETRARSRSGGAVSGHRVGGIAQAVADEVERQHGNDDEQPRNQPPGRQAEGVDVLRLTQQHAPTHHRRSQPEAEKAQRGLGQDHRRYAEREGGDDVAQERRDQVAGDDLGIRGPGDLAGHHEVFLAQAEELASHRPRQIGPADQRDGDAAVDAQCTSAPATL